jgi:archaellum component FlaF (FlaF/FlaG flagellin family)
MNVTLDTRKFQQDMNNIVKYSFGFLEGIEKGKVRFLEFLGKETIEVLKQYIDSNARTNPSALHHVYEWYQVGSPDSRLFDIVYTVSNLGLSIKSTFRQSSSIQNGSTTPFYNKARIMENGTPVTIRPKKAKVLAFESNGQEVFTKKPVTVMNPGGNTANKFEQIFDTFMLKYFKQSFLKNSGLLEHLKNPVAYKRNLSAGKKAGRSKGVQVGYRWITNVGVGA